MELRTHFARATRDIDFTLHARTRLPKGSREKREHVRGMLQQAAGTHFDDYFEFLIGEAREDLDGAPEGGNRYPVEARMDGREFARFHVDMGIGDEVLQPLDVVKGEDWLNFAGVKASSFPVISAAQQFAEKLHAYTFRRRERVNTRTKDLIDMILLMRGGKLDRHKVGAAIRATFTKRATHRLPSALEEPPADWESVFNALARECNLVMSLQEGFQLVRDFVQTV